MDLVLDSSSQFTIYSGNPGFNSIQVGFVLESVEHEIGDHNQNYKRKVGSYENPDLIPVIRGVLNFFFDVRL
jgi:hypothetical protein